MPNSFSESTRAHLKIDKVLELLKPDGVICKSFKGFEVRDSQKKMLEEIIEAYNDESIALIEAGTGTGKSLAYLVPAILWSLVHQEKTVISTKTINLQEQILQKDIPQLAKALNISIKAVLVKGMQNYVCMRRLEETRQEALTLSLDEAIEVQKIEAWCYTTSDGSKSSLPFIPTFAMWEKVCAEYDTCTRTECPYFQDCHFFKARKEAQDAQLIIVNHHILFSDLNLRSDETIPSIYRILPDYKRLIIDEAHHIEDIATEFFGSRINYLTILKLLGRLSAEKDGKDQGKIPLLRQKIIEFFKNQKTPEDVSRILTRLNLDFAVIRKDVQQYIVELFQGFNEFLDQSHNIYENEASTIKENKLRVLSEHIQQSSWQTLIIPKVKRLEEALKQYLQMIDAAENDLKSLKLEKLDEMTKGIRFEIKALKNRLDAILCAICDFSLQAPPANKVRWIESQLLKYGLNTSLIDVELDVSSSLAKYLFLQFPTIVLCSATLTTNQKFNYVKKRLGLNPEWIGKETIVKENVHPSPFNYENQAIVLCLNDIPYPNDSNYIITIIQSLQEIFKASQGNAFVLFTSYSMLKTCYEELKKICDSHKMPLLKQGDEDRQTLLNKFKTINRSILFATDSFWEGVDVVGDALRCVVIVKLPFKVPSEPIIQARSEAILAAGGDPFFEYSLPHAIVKFKQGFGRLIRHHKDRGCIICLDKRLFSKNYGKQFLNSLPDCQKRFVSKENMIKMMNEFYRKTYHLTKE